MKEVISFLKKLAENDDLRKRDDLRDFYGTDLIIDIIKRIKISGETVPLKMTNFILVLNVPDHEKPGS